MVFERGQHYETRYQTPYGEMLIRIQTVVVETSLDLKRGQGSAHMEYQLYADAGVPAYRTVHIHFSAPGAERRTDHETLFQSFAD